MLRVRDCGVCPPLKRTVDMIEFFDYVCNEVTHFKFKHSLCCLVNDFALPFLTMPFQFFVSSGFTAKIILFIFLIKQIKVEKNEKNICPHKFSIGDPRAGDTSKWFKGENYHFEAFRATTFSLKQLKTYLEIDIHIFFYRGHYQIRAREGHPF